LPKPSSVKDNKVTIKIPRALYNNIRTLIADSGFSSTTEFIVFVLRDLVGERERTARSEDLSQDEIAAIRRRLKNLGYL